MMSGSRGICLSPGETKRKGGGAIGLKSFRKNMKIYLTKEKENYRPLRILEK